MGFAYHSGTMVNDNTRASSPEKCLEDCNALASCKFWDYGDYTCRLRSDAGKGKEPASGYLSGTRNCIFSKMVLKYNKFKIHFKPI